MGQDCDHQRVILECMTVYQDEARLHKIEVKRDGEDSVHVIGAESDERISPTNFHDSERQQKYCSGIFAENSLGVTPWNPVSLAEKPGSEAAKSDDVGYRSPLDATHGFIESMKLSTSIRCLIFLAVQLTLLVSPLRGAPINISDFFCGFKMSRTGSMKEPVETPVLTEVEKLGRASTSEHNLHPDRPYGVSHSSSPSASPERSAGETSEEGNLIEHDQAEPSNPDPFEVDSMIYKDWLNSVSIPPPAK
ncbi:hypothetical protein Pst134EA_023153 [Puccinia striiformis f. sp. tritici]|uniref:hypothetical protein n=1 Tax=Puccinia striiformis f. sp. tritici TaxID=168172 RepID=UPI002007754F|nr:hypothetical protein Pst134EA_023153 [Puccinia striiformis f. sp. tritici]KAH9455697.1 hypothetical protein Pst134EA_023153 [Puccinia striiformis f. sp. tritici]